MIETSPQFLDVEQLLQNSRPRSPGMRMGQIFGIFLLLILGSAYISSRGAGEAELMDAISELAMFGLVGTLLFMSWRTMRRTRVEAMALQAIEELLALRRWSEAAMMLKAMLSKPTVHSQTRTQGLIFLSGLFARYHRFDDSIRVQDELLEESRLDGGTEYGLRLARAMAMLRQDHLVDADRAINELRNQASRAGRAMNAQDPSSPHEMSAGLALLEIYRDIKTGHSAEVIELFESALPALRQQLGHRLGDAHMLVARAYDLLSHPDKAQDQYTRATLLAPAGELHRRYPETEALAGKYQPAVAPREAA